MFAAPAAAAPYDDAAYWAFADRSQQQQFDDRWDEQAGYYQMGGGGVEPMANSMLLLTHAVAAMDGHTGPARNDHRARILAERLVSGTPYVTKPGAGQSHAPGWVNTMSGGPGGQHLVFDAEVVDGLVYAYRAREALQLPASTVEKIRNAIHRTARGKFWRYPTIRLNQVNWYALMYAADATVTGDNTLLKRDMHLQLKRFFSQTRAGASRIGNFGPGMRFHYLPHMSTNNRSNVDSAEYSNIVLTFTRFYDQARRAGMPALDPSARHVMREWITRVVSGYWTHAGYMNWDSGLGFNRWHQGKKLGLTQEALVGLASSDTLLPSAKWGQWAKSMLDNGFDFYARLSARSRDGLVDPVLFDVTAVPQGVGSARLAAARVQANAARAVDAGLGAKKAATPPPLYSYDPDIGRLAVTTPTYNTAIVAVNQNAFPYGGLDLARLYDGQQEVAANIGGRPPAAFGLLVRDVGGRRVTASQVGRARVVRGVRPLRLTKAPIGAGAISSVNVGRAYAGPFSDLRATGTSRGPRPAPARVAPLHARLDPDDLDRDPPQRQRPLHRRRALPELARRRQRPRRRGAARRNARRRRLQADQARLDRLPVGAERALRLRRRARLAPRRRRRARHAPRAAELRPEARPDAGGPDRPRLALQPRLLSRLASCPCTTSRKPRPRRRDWDDVVRRAPAELRSWLSVPSSRRDGPPRSSA